MPLIAFSRPLCRSGKNSFVHASLGILGRLPPLLCYQRANGVEYAESMRALRRSEDGTRPLKSTMAGMLTQQATVTAVLEEGCVVE
jgi:hypothetical protein